MLSESIIIQIPNPKNSPTDKNLKKNNNTHPSVRDSNQKNGTKNTENQNFPQNEVSQSEKISIDKFLDENNPIQWIREEIEKINKFISSLGKKEIIRKPVQPQPSGKHKCFTYDWKELKSFLGIKLMFSLFLLRLFIFFTSKMSVVIPVSCDQDVLQILKRHLDEGTIKAETSSSFSTFRANKNQHENIIDDWISDYGGNDEKFKSKLRQLKRSDSGRTSNFATTLIDEGSQVVAVLVHFSEKQGGMRSYNTASVQVKLTSSCARDWAQRHPKELAILALSGGNSEYTLRIEN